MLLFCWEFPLRNSSTWWKQWCMYLWATAKPSFSCTIWSISIFWLVFFFPFFFSYITLLFNVLCSMYIFTGPQVRTGICSWVTTKRNQKKKKRNTWIFQSSKSSLAMSFIHYILEKHFHFYQKKRKFILFDIYIL